LPRNTRRTLALLTNFNKTFENWTWVG